MSDVSAVTKLLPTVNEGFTTTLSGTISAGATTVPFTNIAGLTNNSVFVGIIEPGTSKEQTFTGTVNTGSASITGVVWTRGVNTSHLSGVTVVDYVTGTAFNMLSKWGATEHNQNGTHSNINATSVTATGAITAGSFVVSGSQTTVGWNPVGVAVSSVTPNGNRSYTLTYASAMDSILSPGMRLQAVRNTAAPTQCTSLNGTTQYWNNTSPNKMTFTNNFVVSAWVKATAYAATDGTIISRYNGTSGWGLRVTSTGQVYLVGVNGGSGNYSLVQTIQSLPLNKWVHITAQLDMATFTATPTTSYVMFDGVDVPCTVGRAGTNPTSLIQAGNIEVGAENGGTARWFTGQIAQVAVFSAKVTQATMLGYISQGLVGTETNLASAYSFNGVATDLNTTTPNNLAAQNAAGYVTGSPFGNNGVSSTLDYALIMAVSGSSVTVQVPEGCTIPTTGGVSTSNYSTVDTPYGFPRNEDRFFIITKFLSDVQTGAETTNIWASLLANVITVPVGDWRKLGFKGNVAQQTTSGTPSTRSGWIKLSVNAPTENIQGIQCRMLTVSSGGGSGSTHVNAYVYEPVSLSSKTTYSLWGFSDNAVATETTNIRAQQGEVTVFAEPAGL